MQRERERAAAKGLKESLKNNNNKSPDSHDEAETKENRKEKKMKI